MPHGKKIVRCFVLVLFVALLATVLWAQSPPIGAVVQTWHYDAQTNMVRLQVINTSHKDITGYNISIKEDYADGHTNSHEMLCDRVGGEAVIHPGAVQEENFPVQPGLRDYVAVVDVVAYADGTAEAPNNDGLERLLTHRRAEVASIQKASEIIKAALADPNDANPAATTATKIQELITIWKAQQHTTLDLEPALLKGMIRELNAISSSSYQNADNKRDLLKQRVARMDEEIATLSPHTKLTKVGGPQ